MNKQLKTLTLCVVFLLIIEMVPFYFGSSSNFSPNLGGNSGSFSFGNTAIGTNLDQNDANAKSASAFICDSNGQITDIYAYVAGAVSTGTGKAAIYADNSGQPGVLIAQSFAESIPSSFSWVDFQLNTLGNVTSGSIYWLSICSDESLNLYVVGGSGVRVHNGNNYSGGFSNPFGYIWGTDSTGAMSIYASANQDTSKLSVSISPTSANIAIGGSKQFNSIVTGDVPPDLYQWVLNYSIISGANSPTWIFTPTETGQYNLYLNVTDSQNQQTQSNIITDISVYNQSQTSSLTPDWTNVTQDFFHLVPGAKNPVLTGGDVTDRVANFVADPFIFHEGTSWYMFFEVESNPNNEEIGVATSSDGFNWTYQKIVLSDPSLILSYPYVFKWDGTYYLMPNTYPQGVMLYKATDFPYNWTLVNTLISNQNFIPVDSSIFRYNNTWWIFTGSPSDLRLFYSYNLTDPASWHEHPMSPLIVNDDSAARGGGRVTIFDSGRIIRLAQKDDIGYGEAVRAFEVDALNETYYAEHEIPQSPIIKASGSGWNSLAMHTVDPWWSGNSWVVAVDGGGDVWWAIGIYVTPLQSVAVSPTAVGLPLRQSQTFDSSILGGKPSYSYQWYLNDIAVSGADSSTWTFTPSATGNYKVYVDVTDGLGTMVQSNIVTDIVVYPQATTLISPSSVNITVGATQQFTSTTTGGSTPYKYQWYLNETVVLGANSSNWNFTPGTTGHYTVYLKVIDALSFEIQSNIITDITVNPQPTAAIIPASVNMTIGNSQTFRSTVTGGTTPYSYQWYINGTAVSTANNANWIFTSLLAGTYSIYLNVTDHSAITVKSNIGTARVETPTNVTITPTQVKMDLGQSKTFNSTLSNGTAPYSYQWYLNGTAVPGAINPNWTFTPSIVGFYEVYLNVTDALNLKVQSNIVKDITVFSSPTVAISPASVNLTDGNPQTFTSIVSGGAQPYIYQWYLNGTLISNANSSSWTYTPTAAGNLTVYLIVKDNNTQSAQSNIATVKVGNTLSLTINTDRPRYIKWSYVKINVNVTDLLNGTSIQGASVNITIYDTHGRLIWTRTGLTDTVGTAQFTYLLAFDAQFGNYKIAASVTVDGYNQKSIQTTFFSLG
jgi:hypothetical protein